MIVNKTNLEIYNQYKQLQNAFIDENRNFPVKVFFYIQKNINVLKSKVEEIEQTREYIIKKYGSIDYETNHYDIPKNNLKEANIELSQLENLSQDLDLALIDLKDIENLELKPNQIESLMFMIQE